MLLELTPTEAQALTSILSKVKLARRPRLERREAAIKAFLSKHGPYARYHDWRKLALLAKREGLWSEKTATCDVEHFLINRHRKFFGIESQ